MNTWPTIVWNTYPWFHIRDVGPHITLHMYVPTGKVVLFDWKNKTRTQVYHPTVKELVRSRRNILKRAFIKANLPFTSGVMHTVWSFYC